MDLTPLTAAEAIAILRMEETRPIGAVGPFRYAAETLAWNNLVASAKERVATFARQAARVADKRTPT